MSEAQEQYGKEAEKRPVTAVEWLIDRIEDVDNTPEIWEKIKEHAKQMEKGQIVTAHFDGQCDETEGYPIEIAEQYYNETYESKTNL